MVLTRWLVWLPRIAAVAMLAVVPGACGFRPLYGSPAGKAGNGNEETELAKIQVDTIADRQGQKLRNFLIDDLQGDGMPPPPEHELIITYTESQVDLGLNNDATTTRGQLTIALSFTLKDLRTGAGQLSGTAQQITGYNIQNSEFATILSRDDAEDRALRALADNLQLRLALYFRNVAAHPPKPADAAKPGDKPASTPAAPIQTPAQPIPFAPHAPGQVFDNGSPITQTPDAPAP